MQKVEFHTIAISVGSHCKKCGWLSEVAMEKYRQYFFCIATVI